MAKGVPKVGGRGFQTVTCILTACCTHACELWGGQGKCGMLFPLRGVQHLNEWDAARSMMVWNGGPGSRL